MRNGDEIPQPPPAFTANGGLNHQHQHQQHQSTAWPDESEDSDSQPQFAPHYVPGDAGASDDELDGRVPVQHRDNASHATFVWGAEARGADSLHPPWMDRADKPAFTSSFTLETKLKQPLNEFVLLPVVKTPSLPASASLSRSSPLAEVPLKDASDVFSHADQSFPSTTGGYSPTKIMDTVRNALLYFDALECKEIPEDWRLDVSCLCVAEQIDFSIQLSRLDSDGESVGNRDRFEVSFHRTFGDEARYLELTECIRSRCRAIDDDPLVFLPETLDSWMDARQEITDRRAAIGAKDALELLKQLHADLHVMTLHEIAKEIKDHCRHQGNRTTFYRVDPTSFLSGLREMLSSSSLEMSRFGVFILLQFAKDHDVNDRDDRFSPFFRTPYDKSSFAMLLHDVAAMHQDAPCGEFTCEMVTKVQKSWVFAPIALLSQLRNSSPPPQMPGTYRFRRSMTTFRPVTATTALETLAAARILIPGDEEILFAFTDENGQELVFTTESVITFYPAPPPTATKRTDFSLIHRLSFLDASDATASDSGDGKKEDAVVFVMGPAHEEMDFTIVIAQDNDEPDEKKKNQFAKTVFNAIFLLQNTAKLRDERKRSVTVVKNMLAAAQAIPRSPVSATTEIMNDSTTWFGGGGMGYGYFSS